MTAGKNILEHLKKVDSTLYQVAVKFDVDEVVKFENHRNYFERLCRAIVGQQLSTKAAATIWGRFAELVPNKEVTPNNVALLQHEMMRGAGLSNAKARYVHALAVAVIEKEIDLENLDTLSNEAVISELTKLKGVGVWTAEMFLMFTLLRPDVFSVGDLGLRRAMEKIYGLSDPSAEVLIEISSKWSPYRTYVCRILWESLDNNPSS